MSFAPSDFFFLFCGPLLQSTKPPLFHLAHVHTTEAVFLSRKQQCGFATRSSWTVRSHGCFFFVQLYSFPIHLLRFKCIKSVSEPTKGLPCKSMLPGFNNDVIVLKKRHVNKDFVAHADMPFVPGSGSTHKCQFVRNQRSDKFPATQPDFG